VGCVPELSQACGGGALTVAKGKSNLAVPPWGAGGYGSRVEGQLPSQGLTQRPVLTLWSSSATFFSFLVLSLSLISWHHFEALFDLVFSFLIPAWIPHFLLCALFHAHFTLVVVEGPGQYIATIIDNQYIITTLSNPLVRSPIILLTHHNSCI
jgi:hypothetical protein